MNMASKKLINSAEDVVDEALAGLVASCPGLRLLKGHRVIVRADVQQVVAQGKVGIYRCMLSCIVCGMNGSSR